MNICLCGAEATYPHAADCPWPQYRCTDAQADRWQEARAALRDSADFFAPPEEQRTLYQEGACKPGWVEGMPLPAAKPLYEPGVSDPRD